MSRPYHKFFNVNEKEETQAHMLDLLRPHAVMDKLDGSMIRPIRNRFGTIRLATKMGITDVSEQAEQIMDIDQWHWLEDMMIDGFTPILEYIAPTNKIVVEYAEPKLILTAVRETEYGVYRNIRMFSAPFEVVRTFSSVEEYLEYLLE
jgi:RNA ligase